MAHVDGGGVSKDYILLRNSVGTTIIIFKVTTTGYLRDVRDGMNGGGVRKIVKSGHK